LPILRLEVGTFIPVAHLKVGVIFIPVWTAQVDDSSTIAEVWLISFVAV
jgi:hypothetical protein